MSSEKHSGMHKKIPPRRDAELADFGQGSGVTPDSDNSYPSLASSPENCRNLPGWSVTRVARSCRNRLPSRCARSGI